MLKSCLKLVFLACWQYLSTGWRQWLSPFGISMSIGLRGWSNDPNISLHEIFALTSFLYLRVRLRIGLKLLCKSANAPHNEHVGQE